jgi:hypothetical protein
MVKETKNRDAFRTFEKRKFLPNGAKRLVPTSVSMFRDISNFFCFGGEQMNVCVGKMCNKAIWIFSDL